MARRKERIEELAKKLESKPGKLYAVKADVTKEDEIFVAYEWVTKNVGPVSILVNNAGLARNTTIIDGKLVFFDYLQCLEESFFLKFT